MANSKKINEITQVQSLGSNDLLIADTANGTRSIKYGDLAPMEQKPHLYRNGAYLPSVSLGNSYTAELKEDISSGKFEKAIVGGYLTINGHIYDFAHPDYWLHTGDTECTQHHMVVVPRTNLVTAQMNASNITDGAYVGSNMKKEGGGIDQIRAIIQADFGAANILTHREYFANAVSAGRESAGSWYNSDIDLMNEHMVYGGKFFEPTSDGSTVPYVYSIDKSQLELFAKRPDLITNRADWWLRGVVSAPCFARVYNAGLAAYNDASYSDGVRPAFAIC